MTDGLQSYRPGSWFGIFGDHATVLLPGAERPRVAALWELVDAGAGFAVVLDALISGGLRDLSAFLLVSEGGPTTQVVARGPVRASLTTRSGETVVVDGTQASTWVERSVDAVTSLQVELEESEAPDLTLKTGLVRLGRVDRPPFQEQEQAQEQEEAAPEEAVQDVAEEPVDEAVDDIEVEPAVAVPVVDPEPAPPAPFAEAPAPPSVEEPDREAEAQTVREAVEEDPQPPPVVPGLPTEAIPAVEEPEAEGPLVSDEPVRPVARLVLSSGEQVDVDRATLIGRAPEARRFSMNGLPRLVTVPSPNHEISSTHLEVRPGSGAQQGTVIVTDMGSTNGTVLVQPGEPPEDLQPGIPVQLVPGAIIDLGDGVTISVTQP